MQTSELRAQPEQSWREPKVEFQYPADALLSRIKDHFLQKYSDNISEQDACFLAGIFAEVTPEDLVSLNERRIASQRMCEVLVGMDQAMSGSKNPVRTWATICLALGLPSACQSNGNKLARRYGISKVAVSKSAKKLREVFHVGRAFDNHGSLTFTN